MTDLAHWQNLARYREQQQRSEQRLALILLTLAGCWLAGAALVLI
jgi:hypothetical protein